MIIPDKPGLIIKYFGNPAEDYCDLEQARYILNFDRGVVLVDGQRVRSYDELVKLAAQEKNRNKEYLEVVVGLFMVGG